MKVLIAEDEVQKLAHIRDFVEGLFSPVEVIVAKSVRSAIASIEKDGPDVLLLDMSLPTFDIGIAEPGGRPQGFGGIEVLRYADFLGIALHAFVITAYEGFEEGTKAVDLSELELKLRAEHGENFKGIVYYSGLGGDWERSLEMLIRATGLSGDDQ